MFTEASAMLRLRFLLPLLLTLGAAVSLRPAEAQMAVSISAPIPPPELPMYEQPPIPAPGYIWVPGYWAFGRDGYYWVPGTWILPPAPGLLWTPSYWASTDGAYVFVPGYWAPSVGFYGGIDYGFGYSGVGYDGGYWLGSLFFYNRLVNNFGAVHIDHVFTRPVADRRHNQVSFTGGQGGTALRPTPEQEALAREKHTAMTPPQFQHERAAALDRALWDSVNHGHPAVAATARPGGFTGPGAAAHAPSAPERPGTPAAMPHVVAPDVRAPVGPRPENSRQFRPGPRPGEHAGAPYFQEPAPAAGREAPEFRPMPAPHPGPQPYPRPERQEEQRPPGPRPEPLRQFRPGPLPGDHPGAPHFREPAPAAGREAPEFRPMPGPHPGPQPHLRPEPREERRPPGP